MHHPIPFTAWSQTLQGGAAFFGQSLTDAQIRLFYRHAEMLRQWNRAVNLTAITEPHAIAVKHFLDSFGPAVYLPPMRRVLDVGSGGGFPGLPLKVCCPAIELTLVDAVRKKVSFLKHVIRELALKKTRAWHARVEALSRQTPPPHFDTIVCRAFSDLAFAVKHLAPLLDDNGRIVVWKGRRPDQEIQEIMPLIEVSGRTLTLTQQSYTLPFFEAQRTLVILTSDDRGVPKESVR